MDINEKYIKALEKTYNELLESLNNVEKTPKGEKEKQKTIEKMNSTLLELITITETPYSNEYNAVLNIEPSTLNEELKRLESLKSIIKARIQYISSFLKKHKKVAADEMYEQFESFLKDEKLQTVEESIKIIKKYMKNVNRINFLNKQIENFEEELTEIEKNQATYKKTNEELENELNGKIKNLLQGYQLDDANFKEKEVDYREYKELYNKLEEKVATTQNPSEELLQMLEDTKKDYTNSNNTYYLLKLLYNAEDTYTICEDCIQKRQKIDNILDNLIGLEITDITKELIDRQLEELSGQKQEAARKESLNNKKTSSINEKENLELENNAEEVVKIVSKYPYVIEPEKEEIPVIENPNYIEEMPKVDSLIKNNNIIEPKKEEIASTSPASVNEEIKQFSVLEGPNGLVIVSTNKPEESLSLIEANKDKTIEWMKKVISKLEDQQKEQVKSR